MGEDVGAGLEWERLLGTDGPLGAALSGFRPRTQQMEMAAACAQAVEAGGTLVLEAGTGTGKTFAYLLPVLLSGRKVLVSTGSKALQDQLLEKDLPLLKRAFGSPATLARLKGRANYLCPYRLRRHCEEGTPSRDLAAQLERVREWSGRTREGDIAELTGIPEGAPVWPLVTSTRDNCLGSDCPDYQGCFVMEARRRAFEADLVVVNHHLLFADLALKAEGMGDLLPRVEAVILDEAHQLPEVAGQFFGSALSVHRILDLARDCRTEGLGEAPDQPEIGERAAALEGAAESWRRAWMAAPERGTWRPPGMDAAGQAWRGLGEAIDGLLATLGSAAARGKGLESCHRRALDLAEGFAFFTQAMAPDTVFWYERRGRGLAIHASPVSVADPFQETLVRRVRTLILTSATLSVHGDFSHFRERLGLWDAVCRHWDSPFDYAVQSLLYLPTGLPDPRREDYTRACLEAALPVLRASRGRAFFLFTSHRALQEAAAWLPGRLSHPCLVQGQMPKSRLLEAFRAAGDAVLLGAASFWEGVDVRGEALSCVIIDKLPFAAPDDPLLQARAEMLRAAGRDPFRDYQLPQAVIALKQGAGRLIRAEGDLGCLMICDPRLTTKAYGRMFLDSLPPMPRTDSLAGVERFFTET